RLERWLQQSGHAAAPEGQGYWGQVLDTLYRRQRDQQAQCLRLEHAFLHLQDSFRALADAVVILDADAAIEWLNPAAERLLGLRTDRDRGTPIGNLLRDPDFLAYFEAGVYTDPLLIDSPRDARLRLEVRLTFF